VLSRRIADREIEACGTSPTEIREAPALGSRRSKTICGSRLVCVLIARKVRVDVSQIRQRSRGFFTVLSIIFLIRIASRRRPRLPRVCLCYTLCSLPFIQFHDPGPAHFEFDRLRMLSAYAAIVSRWDLARNALLRPLLRARGLPVTFAKFNQRSA